MNQRCEDDDSDYIPLISRPESAGRKHAMPDWLLEAAKKAGKQYNELTGSFEPIPAGT